MGTLADGSVESVRIDAFDAGLNHELEYPALAPPDDQPGYGENEGFWVWDDDAKAGMHLWIGTVVDYGLRFGRVTIWLPDGRVLTNLQHGPGTTRDLITNGVLSCRPTDPYRSWDWSFFGPAQPTTAAILRDGPLPDDAKIMARVEASATMLAPPFQNGGFRPRDQFLDSPESQLHGGWRFEQFLRAEGHIQVKREPPIRFSGVGNRTHRKGSRNVTDLHGHVWMNAIFPSGRGFYVMWFPEAAGKFIPAECFILEGNTFYPADILDPPLIGMKVAGEEEIRFHLKWSGGLEEITGQLVADSFQTLRRLRPELEVGEYWGVDWRPDHHNLGMDQGFFRYHWGGETACGMVERSLPVETLAKKRRAA